MPAPGLPAAIVTGASSGIGRATALSFVRSGYRVFATVRTAEAEASLREESRGLPLEVDRLEVSDESAVDAFVHDVLRRGNRIDVLVNNAGYAQLGAAEDLPRDALRQQFEVNVFGPMQLCREVLPTMRAQRFGRIVNVSSLAGRISVPLMGAYCASKFALEAFSDAMRVEEKRFGIGVAIVEPGQVDTRFQRAALESSRRPLQDPSVFQAVYASYLREFETHSGARPEQVARVILRAARARRPRSRYRIRWRETFLTGITQLIPKGAMDWGTAKAMGLDQVREG